MQIAVEAAELRGPENFGKVVDAIPRLVERGVRVRIATTVESIEDAELDRLCALHRDLGVPAGALLRLVEDRPPGDDVALNIR